MIEKNFWNAKHSSEAKNNPNGWVYDIDFPYPDEARVPPEAIVGAWKVDGDGNLTSQYVANKNYRPIVEKEKVLPQFMHAAAKFCRNMWMIEVEKKYEYLFPNYPPEAILGYWYVNEDGDITKKFRPVRDDEYS